MALTAPLVTVSPAFAAEQLERKTDNFFDTIEEYQRAHPLDLVGLESLANELGGEITVSTDQTGPTTVQRAAQILDSFDGQDRSGSGANVNSRAYPQNAFTVQVVKAVYTPSPNTYSITGIFNWRDDLVGQGDPYDIAALTFTSGCGTLNGHFATSYTYDGMPTNKVFLRDAGVNTKAPIWNVNAYPVGFVNQADNGIVSVRFNKTGCSGTKQAAFYYEGNQGGSIVSVSAGFAGLNVGYSSNGFSLQKSSNPINF